MTRDTRRQAVFIAGVTLAVVWWLGGFLLTGNATLGFRDAASFYEPRWAWLVQHWAQGIFPQWNPLENAGTDVVADPTYGVFYPFKVLLLIPLAWPLPYHIFLLFHSILAWGAAYRAARCMPASPFAAALGATSYAFGGHVLAQMHNAVYLVSAAWLPLAWCSLYRLERRPSVNRIARAAVPIAMIVLGGDPQAVIHLVIVLVAARAWRMGTRWLRRGDRGACERDLRWKRSRGHIRLGALAAAFLLAALLASAQWHPTWCAMGSSFRQASESHRQVIYEFSVGPWRWLELVWPGFAGRLYPTHARWLSYLPAEGRVWSPTLYMGLWPAVACLAAGFGGRRARAASELRVMLAVSVLAALGMYGAGWVIRDVGSWAGFDRAAAVDPAVGGLYWFFVQVVPGYSWFRYPAKWWTFAALAMSLLSASETDRLLRHDGRLMRIVGWLAGATALACVAWGASFLAARALWEDVRPDAFFGPFDWRTARWVVGLGLLQTTILLALFRLLASWVKNRAIGRSTATFAACCERRRRHAAAAVLFVVTSVDLALAHGWILWPIPATGMEQHTKRPLSSAVWPRLVRVPQRAWVPPEWSREGSTRRLAEAVAWDRGTFYGHHCLTRPPVGDERIGIYGVPTPVGPPLSIRPATKRQVHAVPRNWPALSDRRSLQRLGVVGALVPADHVLAHFGQPVASNAVLVRWSDPVPGWIVRAGIESERSNQPNRLSRPAIGRVARPAGTVEFSVDLPWRAEVELPERWAPGWSAVRVTGEAEERVPVGKSTAGTIRLPLPAGRHRVIMRYASPGMWRGLAASALGLALLVAAVLTQFLPPVRSKK